MATFIHSISSLIQLGLHVDSPPTTAYINYITSNRHLCRSLSLYWYMTLITQLAAFWFVEVVLTNYQDVYTVSLNLLNLLSLITCSVYL